MGITAKPINRTLKRMLKKIENEKEREHKLLNKSKSKEVKNA